MPAAAALESFGSTFAAIGGPAIGGILISTVGLAATYALDGLSFAISIGVVAAIRSVAPPADAERPSLGRVLEGFRYALSRKDLLGTYLIDMNAMFFGMPYALFPAIAERLGGGKVLGLLYAAPAFGAFLASATSGWTGRVHRHGRAIAIAAAFWGVAIIAFGFTTDPLACIHVPGPGRCGGHGERGVPHDDLEPDDSRRPARPSRRDRADQLHERAAAGQRGGRRGGEFCRDPGISGVRWNPVRGWNGGAVLAAARLREL